MVDASGGNLERATIYLGGGFLAPRCGAARRIANRCTEIDDQGTWTKYVHDDAKRVGNAGAAQKFFHHRDR